MAEITRKLSISLARKAIKRYQAQIPQYQQRAIQHQSEELRGQQLDFILQLVDARHAKHLTQTELAIRIGCSRVTLARMESGAVSPNLNVLIRLAETLDLNLNLTTK